MPLTRLDNLITSKTGKYLYVSPDDFNASDELNNRGNSPVRPFKSIQRAFLEVARYSYLPGVDNDRFDQFTIMLMPGEHFIDNRPGVGDVSLIDVFGFDDANNEWTDNSILDLSNPDNIFYKFNNTEGGAIIPRGTSLVGYDLRRTMVKPLYVPDPADSREPRSAIFNVTGGCYFWQFTIKDGETTSLSPLYNPNAAVPSGEVYYSKDDFTKKTAPNYSHHKLTVFEYADKEELQLLYRKIARAFSAFQPQINQPGEFDVRVQENRIVGPLSDSRAIESLQFDDATSDPAIPGSNVRVTVTTKVDHGYFAGQSVAVLNTDIDDKLEGTFNIATIDPTDGRKFTYFVFGEVVSTIGPGSNAGASGISPGDVLDITSSPALGQNALTLAEVDSVESASPYVFNCSIRSTWGICGIWANGLKATGFKSMVIAQYTGVSLQKDDRAFIRYDEFTNTFNQASLKDAFDSIPYHTKGDSFWKDEWRNFHVRASEDAFIQNVSIFAVGFADHFLMESGGDMSITNSNSNFGNTSLHAIGHKGFAFNSDKGGYIDSIIPPQAIETTDKKINYYPFNIPAMLKGVEGIQTESFGTLVYNNTRLYLDSNDDALNPAKRPAVSIDGYRLGARQGELIYTKLEKAYDGDDQQYSAELEPSGFIKYIAKPDILAPSGGTIDNLSLDAANLIEANRTFFQEEVFGYVLEKYPNLQQISYVNPGLDPESNRYQDARNLILSNRDEIIDSAYNSMYTAFGPAGENNAQFLAGNDETKCKRDIGHIVDAIAEDLRDGGNSNIINATKFYFNPDGTPLANGLVGEERFAVFAFKRARDLCKLAIANLLTVTDTTVTVDPANTQDSYYTPSDATYDPATGLFTVTIGNHNFTTSNEVELTVDGFTFTCDMDSNQSQKTYPRATDPAANTTLSVISVTDTTLTVNVGASAADQVWQPSAADYNAATGDMEITIGAHTLTPGEGVVLADNSFTFTCDQDGFTTQHTYPRPGQDPWAGKSITIDSVTATSITINVGDGGTASGSTHQFVSATANAVQHLPQSAHTFIAAATNALRVTGGASDNLAGRYKDARNLIQANKADMISAAIAAIQAYNPSFVFPGGSTTKCERDLGLIVDAVAQDLWFGGNEYSLAAIEEYFNNNSLISNGVDGEVSETIIALNKLQDQMNLAVNNQLANTDLTITLDAAGDPAIVSDSHADAFNLITANKKFIAKEAYERMKDVYSNTQYSWNPTGTLGWTPRPGQTEQDCLDDVYNVLDELLYNLKFGGNHKAYDSGEIYVTNIFNGEAITSFLDEERDEAARVFAEAKDIAIDVMRNIVVIPTNWTPTGDEAQTRDLTIILDTNNPTCSNIEAALDTLFGIITQAIGTDAGVGNLSGITRTVPAQPTTYVEGNCSDVLNTIDNLVGLMIDALYAGNLDGVPAVNNGNWDCANVRGTIHTLTDIIVDAIESSSLTGLPPVTSGDFTVNAQISKCYRDVGIITDAVINDLRFGGNLNTIQAGEAYFIGNNLEYIDGEKNETLDAWDAIRHLSISALRNHTTQVNGCVLTNGSAIIDVGTNTGLTIGMRVEQYDPNDFSVDAQLLDNRNPIYTNIPENTYIKKKIGSTQIELGVENARLDTGATVPVIGPGGNNITLYFTLEKGQWADTLPTTDPSISTSNAGYPECAGVASAVDTLIDNITTIINNGIGSVDLVEATATSSDYATRSTVFTIDIDGTGSPNPHKFETGTAVRLVPRPRWDAEAGKYVEVDKRLVRLPNGFETNRTYYVIAPGRKTAPYDYSGTALFDGSDQTKIMLAETKANAAAGIYLYSSESDTIDENVEIDIYKFVLDEKYDLDTYKCQLDVAVAGGTAVTGGIVANVAHIFDVPNASTTPQRVFFRKIDESTPLPLLAANLQGDNALANQNDSTAGVADETGRLNPEFEFYTRYVVSLDKPNKVFCIYKTHADAINDTNRITFQQLSDAQFVAYANKAQTPFAFDPRGLEYSNSETGRWYIKVKDTSSDANALDVRRESILWRIGYNGDVRTSPDPKTNDSFYQRQEDNRDKDDRTYKIRYVIPNYLEGVRDPINGFVLKTRTDSTRRLRPQRILLKPAPGNFKSDAFFQNDRNPGERIGWTSNQIIQNLGTINNAYDPYRRDITGAGIDYRKRITTDNNVTMTVQSGRLRDLDGDTYLELNVYDYEPNPEILALNGSSFRTVKITAPQGGLFEINKSIGSGVPTDPHYITWSGYSSGSAYVHAYTNVGSDHYLIIKGDTIDGNLIFSPYANTRFQQGGIYADLLDDPDMGKSLPLKRLIEKGEDDLFYKQNGAPVYTVTPGDIIKEDGSENRYVVASVEDAGEIDDTFYIFDIETLQRRIPQQQDGIYYLTAIRGNISPLPLGAGNQNNFRNFKFSQPISYLYPQNYKNDPYWFTHAGTTSSEKAYAQGLIDPPATYSAADNYVHGLVRTNDSKSSMTKESVLDLIETPAFTRNTFTGDNAIAAQEGNASAGAEDRQIPLAGDSEVFVDQKWYVELRRPSIARAGNHTFEYLGFGPGNYSTGLPARQEIVLTATQDYYAQAKRQDGGIVFYTGINSNGELYIGNRKINAITGEEEFLERAALIDSDDDEDDISSLVTTFEVPVTFNQNITVNGGEGELVSNFNSPVTINVNNSDLTLQDSPLIILSNVDLENPDGSANDPTLDRTAFAPRQSGDIFIGKNEIKAAQFILNARKNGQSYKFQTHTALELQGPTPSNVTPNQSTLYSAGLGGSALDSKQYVKYGTSSQFVLPQDGDILFKGDSVERSGSLGWIYANYFTAIANEEIFRIEFNGTTAVKIVWNVVNQVQVTNASLGIRETSAIRIDNFYPVGTLNGTFNIISPVIGGIPDNFDPNGTYCYIKVGETVSGVSYDNDGDGNVDAPVTNPTWQNVVSNAGSAINGSTPAPTMEFSTANWKEVGVLGGEALRTKTETIGDYRLGINTVAASAHSAYETAFVDVHTDPKANLDVVGTAWITGKSVQNYLNEPAGSLIAKTATGERNAFWVGGDRDNPDATATLRVATDLQRVGINVSSSDAILDKTLTVDGEVRFTQTLTIDNGIIDTPSNSFTLAPTSTDVNLFPEAVTLSIANDYDEVAQQSINIGNSSLSQIVKIGDDAGSSLLYIHSNSQNSVVDIGTVASNVAYNSQIFMGGAFANPNSLFNIRNARLKVDGDLQIGTPSTGTTRMYSFTPRLELFSASGGSNEVDLCRTASTLSISADAGTTTINNSLYVKASERVDGNITLFGGLSAGNITATRGIFGTSVQSHPIGGLANLNIDIYKRVEINKSIDSQGNTQWGGPTFIENAATNTYFLPLNEPIGAADILIGDLILIDREQVDDQAFCEIVRVVDILNPSITDTSIDPDGIRIEVERGQEGTTLRVDHPDNCPITKLTKQENVSYTTSVVPNGTALDVVTITTAEFGGSINPTDILRLSDTELFNVDSVASDANNIQGLRVNDGAEPTAFTVFEVLSTTGQTTIEGPTEVRNDILLTGTTSNNDRKLTITDGTNVTFEVDAADGDTKLLGDLSVGAGFTEFMVEGATGTLTMNGGDILVNDNVGTGRRLEFINGSGNLTIAGVIETEGSGTNLFAGDVELNGGDLTVNDGSTLRFGVNNNGTIDLGGVDYYFGPTGARRWEYVSTVSGDAGVMAPNINYFTKASGDLVIKLPAQASTGDMMRIVDIGGALTYNVRLIFRAPDGIPVAGDSTNTSNAIQGVNLAGYDGGELIVTTPNAAFGLVYAGASLNNGQPSGIPSNLQGWWLMEI